VARVLRPGGAALLSFFVLDIYRGPGTTVSEAYVLEHALGEGSPFAIREAIQRLAAGAGLRVVRLIPGYWSLPDAPSVNEQDPGAVSAGLSPGTPPRREAQSCSDPLSPVITTCGVDQTWPGSGLSRK
jgi:hypothetical protein